MYNHKGSHHLTYKQNLRDLSLQGRRSRYAPHNLAQKHYRRLLSFQRLVIVVLLSFSFYIGVFS